MFETEAGCGRILSIKTVSVLVFPCCQTVAIHHVHGTLKLPVPLVRPKALLYMTIPACLGQTFMLEYCIIIVLTGMDLISGFCQWP